MKNLHVFTISTYNGVTCESAEVKVAAHYVTAPTRRRPLCFWSKPHWYSWPRCVGIFDWRVVLGVRNETPSTDWVKEARVKL